MPTFQAFTNRSEEPRKFIEGYRSGDPTQCTYVGDVPGGSPADLVALDRIFAFLNRDDRPNGTFAPSLSVGDLVTLNSDDERRTRTYRVDAVSFSRVPTRLATPNELAEVRAALALGYRPGDPIQLEEAGS